MVQDKKPAPQWLKEKNTSVRLSLGYSSPAQRPMLVWRGHLPKQQVFTGITSVLAPGLRDSALTGGAQLIGQCKLCRLRISTCHTVVSTDKLEPDKTKPCYDCVTRRNEMSSDIFYFQLEKLVTLELRAVCEHFLCPRPDQGRSARYYPDGSPEIKGPSLRVSPGLGCQTTTLARSAGTSGLIGRLLQCWAGLLYVTAVLGWSTVCYCRARLRLNTHLVTSKQNWIDPRLQCERFLQAIFPHNLDVDSPDFHLPVLAREVLTELFRSLQRQRQSESCDRVSVLSPRLCGPHIKGEPDKKVDRPRMTLL
ncbi:hypothetical protein RRG08_009922 [Elysia crispata]|uniref:Uncharacterized protein n=1 Tax=Elysia crispata TaxID=231223 RepID=A0AAE1ARF5_9GAST|nr:hypothetical protein RRG08_009922 [Elysia crispata]